MRIDVITCTTPLLTFAVRPARKIFEISINGGNITTNTDMDSTMQRRMKLHRKADGEGPLYQ